MEIPFCELGCYRFLLIICASYFLFTSLTHPGLIWAAKLHSTVLTCIITNNEIPVTQAPNLP